MKLAKECALYLTSFVVVGCVAFQNLVHAFEYECPELFEGSIVEYEVTGVGSVVVIRSHDTGAVQL